jgi:formyltetrahydrofolate deformylase
LVVEVHQHRGEEFRVIRADFAMQAGFYDEAVKPRVLILVSKFGHCLNDLLYRYRIGALPIEIPGIVSNHLDFKILAEAFAGAKEVARI